MHKDINPMLTTSDVARLLNVHINTVRRWSNQNVLKAYRIGSRGDRRFERKDIANFLSQRSKIAWGSTQRENLPLTDEVQGRGNNVLEVHKMRHITKVGGQVNE